MKLIKINWLPVLISGTQQHFGNYFLLFANCTFYGHGYNNYQNLCVDKKTVCQGYPCFLMNIFDLKNQHTRRG